VFGELVAGRADVMITDGFEADHRAQPHPELAAATVPAPFTGLEKAYFFARDPLMREFTGGQAIASGRWQRRFDRARGADK
jgi:cyclohexadienyl dehydratase